MIMGFGAIAFVITMEKKKESPDDAKKLAAKPHNSPHEILNRLGLGNPGSPKPALKTNSLPDLFKKAAAKEPAQPLSLMSDPLKSPTVMPLPIPAAADTKAEGELSLKYDELLTEHKGLQEKFIKLESLFTEKSSNLEKSEKTLNNELKNQKEFHKVKDLLEKELKETKDKTKGLQTDVASAQTETQTHFKRIAQLEEKVKQLEVEVLTSETAINDAQAGTQLARNHAADLEAKLRSNENVILEKNQKIEDLISRLNLHSTTNALPIEAEPVAIAAPEPVFEPTPIVDTPPVIEPLPVIEPTAPEPLPEPVTEPSPPTPPINENVVEKGGETPAGETLSLPPDIFANPKKDEEKKDDQEPKP